MERTGTAGGQRCASCDRPVAPGDAVCAACGEPFTPPERKLVTLLFADLTGYTELCSRLDPEEVHHFVRPAMTKLRRVVESYGGSVPQVQGDGFMAVFGAPVAHEDDAERAVRAALELSAEVESINARGQGLRLPALHIGINTGEVLVAGSREASGFSVAGDTVNVAAKLCALAAGGQTLVGERTFELTRGVIHYGSRRMRRVKGLAALVPVYEPGGARHGRHRGRTPSQQAPFRGRDDLLARLQGCVDAAAGARVMQSIVVTGDAGLGKSRLAAEFTEHLTDVLVLAGGCSPYGERLPLAALVDAVASFANVRLPAPADEIRSALRQVVALAGLGDRGPSVVRRLAELMTREADGRTGGADEAHTDLAAVRLLVEGLARIRPVVLLLDDLHWADEELRAALASMYADPWSGAILLLGMARPEAGLPPGVPTVPLGALESEHMVAIIEAITGGRSPAWLADELLNRAGGNPLFLEECVRMLVENGGLTVDVDGGLLVEESQVRLVPNSMRMFIAARLDALPIEEKALLQDAAVGGDAVWDALIDRLAPGGRNESLLARLEQRGLLNRSAESRVPGCVQYDFKHALIRDVAYESLPKRARAVRHRAVADWLGEIYAQSGLRAPAGVLAHHYRQAWLLSRSAIGGPPACEVARLAVAHLRQWSRESFRFQARGAEVAIAQALEIVTEAERCFDSTTRAEIHVEQATVRNELGEFHAALGACDTAEQLLADDDGAAVRAAAMLARSRALSDLGRIPEAVVACDAALAHYTDAGDASGLAAALYQAARNIRYDDVARMNDALRDAYHACREAGATHLQALVARDLAYINTLEGGPQFNRWYAEASRLVDDDSDLRGRANLRRTAAYRAWYAGDYERALTLARDAGGDAVDAGTRWVEADALLCQQAVLAALGRFDECERVMQSTLELASRVGSRRLGGMARARGVRSALRRRHAAEASTRLAEARQILRELGSALDLAAVDGIEAELHLDAGRWELVAPLAQHLVDLCEARGWGLYPLPSRLDIGRAALGLGDEHAVDELATAVDVARRQDAPRLGALAAACLEQAQLLAGHPTSSRIASAAPELRETRAVGRENDGLRALLAGDHAAAATAFASAATEWSTLGTTIWLARVLLWQADALRRAGDAEGAAAIEGPVIAMCEELDAPDGWSARVLAVLPRG